MIPMKEKLKTDEQNLQFSSKLKFLFIVVAVLFANSVLAQQSKWDEELLVAASEENYKNLILALDSGASINAATEDSVTALMFAVETGNMRVVTALLERGADVNIKPWNGKTALIGAVRTNNMEIAELLIRNDADVHISDRYYESTALHYAIASGYLDMVDMLIYYEADPTKPEKKGLDGLNLSAWFGNPELVEYFIQLGMDVNSVDSLGNTPLINSIKNGHFQVAEQLLLAGAAIDQTNRKGYNALHVATVSNQQEIVQLLIAADCNVDTPVYGKLSPIYLARMKRFNPIRKDLKRAGAKRFSGFYIDKIELSFENNIGSDYLMGGGLGLHEVFTNTSWTLSYLQRLHKEPIFFNDANDVYYQYWERRGMFALSGIKNLPIHHYDDQITGLYVGASQLFSFGSWSGSTQRPKFEYITIPHIGFYYQADIIIARFGIEFFEFEHNETGPFRFYASLVFNISRNVSKFTPTKPEWTDEYVTD